jgi:predicted ester cyclase
MFSRDIVTLEAAILRSLAEGRPASRHELADKMPLTSRCVDKKELQVPAGILFAGGALCQGGQCGCGRTGAPGQRAKVIRVASRREKKTRDPGLMSVIALLEVLNAGRLDVIDELYTLETAEAARRWVEPFRLAFPDLEMQTVELVAEGDRVVGRFRCSGTHLGPWRGSQPTGRRMHDIDEVYFFTVRDRRISESWGIEDTTKRIRQLGR